MPGMGMDLSGDRPAGQGLSNDEALALTEGWMERTLSSVCQGDPGEYMKMLADLRAVRVEDAANAAALELRLKVLSHSVYFINEDCHQALIDLVLGMSVWTQSGDAAESLLDFVVNLAITNGGYVGQCMDMLVRNFLPPSCGLPAFLDIHSKAGLRGGWLSMEKICAQRNAHMERKEEVLKRLHAAITRMAFLVPTTTLRLQPVIFRRMPHRSMAIEWNLLFVENMLRLESPEGNYLTSQMLPAIVDHIIKIDVEIRWEDILNEEDNGNIYMFHMDGDEDVDMLEHIVNKAGDSAAPGMEGKSPNGLVKKASEDKAATLDEMADKMDLMMDMTLTHLEMSAKRGQALQVYNTLMNSFQSTILHTHKSKFTQFLIFYLCALEPSTCGSSFASLLCDISTSRSHPPNTRMSAAAYLASYLARAKFLPPDVICTSLERMVSWCIAYGTGEDIKAVSTLSDATLHGVFFSVCQAVMYTLCFRFKMLLEDPEGKQVLQGLLLRQLVDHWLNPLKVCLQSVVEEFLKRAIVLQLVEQKHWLVMEERLDRNSALGDVRLDMFFPFDPYLLRQSDRFIRPNFNFWYMVEPLEENDVSDLEDNHAAAESDISSYTESLKLQYAGAESDTSSYAESLKLHPIDFEFAYDAYGYPW